MAHTSEFTTPWGSGVVGPLLRARVAFKHGLQLVTGVERPTSQCFVDQVLNFKLNMLVCLTLN